MFKILRGIAILLAFIISITSCYTYKSVPISRKYELIENDKVIISTKRAVETRKLIARGLVTDSVTNKEYKRWMVKSVSDSLIVISNDTGILANLMLSDIEYLEIGEKDPGKTWILISVPVIVAIGFSDRSVRATTSSLPTLR